MMYKRDLDYIKRRKGYLGLTNKELSELSGVPLGTLNKFLSGATQYPRKETFDAVFNTLQYHTVGHPDYKKSGQKGASCVRDASVAYGASPPAEERYTVEDYFALSEERRVELIDGVFYDMASPSFIHQQILVELLFRIKSHLRESKSKCIVVSSPLDVQLFKDDENMVQPDLLITCDKSKYEGRDIFWGAPEFVIEIASPSDPKRDYLLKLDKYRRAKVLEYWIVDPMKKTVLVYDFASDIPLSIYCFTDKVRSILFPDLEIDFTEMAELFGKEDAHNSPLQKK